MAHGDITHVELPVANLAASSQFFSNLFGWQIAAPPGFEDYPMWMAPNGISGGALVGREQFSQPVAYVEVDSIDDILAKVTAQGGSVVSPKQNITETSWFAIFTDPDGNNLGLYEGTMG